MSRSYSGHCYVDSCCHIGAVFHCITCVFFVWTSSAVCCFHSAQCNIPTHNFSLSFARKQFFLFARKVACCHQRVCKLVMLVFLVFVLLIADTLSIFIDISVSWMYVMLDCKLLLIISYQPWRLKEAEIHWLCRQKWHLFILLSEMTYHVSNVKCKMLLCLIADFLCLVGRWKFCLSNSVQIVLRLTHCSCSIRIWWI